MSLSMWLTASQDRDPFVQAAKRTPVDLRAWAVGLMERDNRKSHLAPQLSPATQELLRSGESPHTRQGNAAPDFTPTSGEIPIVGDIASPRDYHTSSASRSPTRNGASRSGAVHPGMGQRAVTSGSISSSSGATFNLPVRPAPSSSGGPPQVPRKETPDELRRDGRRAAYPPPSNGGYGYPSR